MSRRSAMFTALDTFAISRPPPESSDSTPGARMASPRRGDPSAGRDLRLDRPPRRARLLDRALVFDGRHVTGVPALNDRPQHAAHDLAAPRLRHHAHEVQLADHG